MVVGGGWEALVGVASIEGRGVAKALAKAGRKCSGGMASNGGTRKGVFQVARNGLDLLARGGFAADDRAPDFDFADGI